MKKAVKRILGVLFTLLLTFIIVQYAGFRLKPKALSYTYCQIKAFEALPENSVDVMIYGSSHAWKGFDAREFTDRYGISAYNYGCLWQHMNTTRLFVKHSFKTQTPKIILIETYIPEVLEDENMNGEIYYTRYLPDSQEKKEYLDQCFAGDWGRYASYYMPLIAFHESWEEIDRKNYVPLDGDIDTFYYARGSSQSDEVEPVDIPDYTQFEQWELPENSIGVLDDIVGTCRSKNIQVIFYTVPSGIEYHYSDAFKKYAEERGCVYLNLYENMDEYQLDPETDFQDKGHLNSSGAKKIADYMGQYIQENYEFES